MSFLDIKLRLKSLDHGSKVSRRYENKIKYDHFLLNDHGRLSLKYTKEERSAFQAEHLVKLHAVQHQRRFVQRNKARYTGLAYGILRGTKYRDIENHVRVGNEPKDFLVKHFLLTFDHDEVGLQEIQSWLAEAERV